MPKTPWRSLPSAILLVAILSPVAAARDLRPPETSQGAIHVYLEPFSQNAARLRFRVQSLAATPADGAPIPIRVFLDDVDGRAVSRQRRLASGPLAPGSYTGLTLMVSGPTVEGKEGPAELISPPGPVEIPVPFQLERGRAVLISLRLDFRGTVEEGFRFTPAFEAHQALLPPVARLGLATSREAAHVALYDKISGAVAGFVPTGRSPSALTVDAERNRAYVALSGDDLVITIDLLNQRVLETLRMQGGDEPTGLALTPDGRTILSANFGSRTLSFINALSLVETDRVSVGDRPVAVMVDRRGQRAWVFNTAASSLSVVDIPRRVTVGALATESEPFWGQLSRRGDVLYVIHHSSPFLSVVDPANLSVTRRLLLGTPATAIVVDSRTDLVYVAPQGAGTIDVYDPLSLLPVESLPVAGDVSFLALDQDERRLHAAIKELQELWIFPLVGKKIAVPVDMGTDTYWMSLVGER